MIDRPICITENCKRFVVQRKRRDGSIYSKPKCHTCYNRKNVLSKKLSDKNTSGVPSQYSRSYRIWVGMRRRCNDSSIEIYKYYGGRGISYCEEWDSYAKFWEDMHQGYDDSLTLDRLDSNGDYNKNNCRWADRVTQMNNKSDNHKVTYNGKTLGINQWSRITGIKRQTISYRLKYGWSVDRALTTGAIK